MKDKKPRHMATMKDVANTAGVSTATVSRALTNPDKVSTVTRQKVEQAALSIGYTSQTLSRTVKRHASRTLLVFVPDMSNPFFAEVLQGIGETAEHHNYVVLFNDCARKYHQDATFMNVLLTKQIEGIILLGSSFPFSLSAEQQRSLPPMVMANEFVPELSLPTVHIDNLTAAFNAVYYLHNIGHRRIACISGPDSMTLSHYRLQGYIQALRRNNIDIESRYIIQDELSDEAGARALITFMALPASPTAIFCHSDVVAAGVLTQAKKMGLHIPRDLSIVGFDNIRLTQYCSPPLTTIAQPRFQIGQKATTLLLEKIEGKPVRNGSYLLDSELIIRESTAPPNH